MNNGDSELPHTNRMATSARAPRSLVNEDELSRLKRELLEAEVRLAKARATMAGAEVDIKVLNAHTEHAPSTQFLGRFFRKRN